MIGESRNTEEKIQSLTSLNEVSIKLLRDSDLPSEIYQVSRVIGKNKALNFYARAKGKELYIPEKFEPSLAILNYLDEQSVKLLISAMPRQRVDFRSRNTGLTKAFYGCKIRILKIEYQKELLKLNRQFALKYSLGEKAMKNVKTSPSHSL